MDLLSHRRYLSSECRHLVREADGLTQHISRGCWAAQAFASAGVLLPDPACAEAVWGSLVQLHSAARWSCITTLNYSTIPQQIEAVMWKTTWPASSCTAAGEHKPPSLWVCVDMTAPCPITSHLCSICLQIYCSNGSFFLWLLSDQTRSDWDEHHELFTLSSFNVQMLSSQQCQLNPRQAARRFLTSSLSVVFTNALH